MGCDIHFYVEQKINGAWKLQGTVINEGSEDEPWYYVKDIPADEPDRNYNLFAILADVRNGRGFAGIKTGEGFNPISPERGIPDDASAEYKSIAAQWGGDGHSHSYHTLRQLLDYDWTQTTTCQGWCDMAGFLTWAARGSKSRSPENAFGSISGNDIVHLTEEQADALVAEYSALGSWDERKAFIEKQPKNQFALAKWTPSYHYVAAHFLSTTLMQLLKLASGTAGLDDVRIIFFFDN